MKLECNVLVDGQGWFTLIPDNVEITGTSAVEIGGRLLEMVSGIKRIEFTKYDQNEKKKPIIIIRCTKCNIPNFIDPNYVHGENYTQLQWHCTFCTTDLPISQGVKQE